MTKIAYQPVSYNPSTLKTLNTGNKLLQFDYQVVNQKIELSNVKIHKVGTLSVFNRGKSQNNIVVTFRVNFKRFNTFLC